MELINGMWWMIAFWFCYLIVIILFMVRKKVRNKKAKRKIDYTIGLFFVYAILFLIVAITTGDPIFEAIGLPAGYEWLGALTLTGFTAWSFYLNPLKNRVVKSERDISIVKNDIQHINKTLEEFKPYIMKKK